MTANRPIRRNPPSAANNSPQPKQEPALPLKPGYYTYSLDQHAYKLVLNYYTESQVINESHKMRVAVAYGLERFWGEHLREDKKQTVDEKKRAYWKDK